MGVAHQAEDTGNGSAHGRSDAHRVSVFYDAEIQLDADGTGRPPGVAGHAQGFLDPVSRSEIELGVELILIGNRMMSLGGANSPIYTQATGSTV